MDGQQPPLPEFSTASAAAAAASAAAAYASSRLDSRDLRLVKELVSGVTRWRRRLDYVISALSKRTADSLEPAMRQVLRMGVYELTQLGTAPHTLNEHVDLAKEWVRPSAAGLANGVLREAARRLQAGTLPDPQADMPQGGTPREKARRLGAIHSHPTWLVSRWVRAFGEDGAVALMRRNNTRPEHSLRANAALLAAINGGGSGGSVSSKGTPAEQLLEMLRGIEGVEAQLSPLLPSEFVRVTSGLQSVLRSGLVSRGLAAVQDESTGLVVQLLDPQPGEMLLDCCAAPGNKALMAAARMAAQGGASSGGCGILAMDISAPRLGALQRAASAQGLGAAVCTRTADLRDAAEAAAASSTSAGGEGAAAGGGGAAAGRPAVAEGGPRLLPGAFQRVLLDAPCSGTGVLAKRADLRWRRTPEQLPQLTALQDQLLDAASIFVSPGGLLVYSTCSIEDEEGMQRVKSFLQRPAGRRFQLEAPPEGLMPGGVVGGEGCLMLLPHVQGVDGAFAARLRHRG